MNDLETVRRMYEHVLTTVGFKPKRVEAVALADIAGGVEIHASFKTDINNRSFKVIDIGELENSVTKLITESDFIKSVTKDFKLEIAGLLDEVDELKSKISELNKYKDYYDLACNLNRGKGITTHGEIND